VAEALELAVLRRGAPEVVSGADDLDRPIRWVHVGEVANLPSLLRGGELVLTTGLVLRDEPRLIGRFVQELADRGIAALVLELGVAFDDVPAALVQAAGEHGLPLIALHREVAFVEVTETVNHTIVSRGHELMRRTEALDARFAELMLDGAGIPEMLGLLASELRNPVVLQREDGELLFHAVHDADSHAVLTAWDDVRRGLSTAPEALTVPLPEGREVQGGSIVTLAVDAPLDPLSEPAMRRAAMIVALVTRQSQHDERLLARERGNLLAEFIEAEHSEAEIARQVDAVGFARRVPYLLPCVLVGPANVQHGARATIWAMVWREIRVALDRDGIPVLGGVMPGDGRIAMVLGLPLPGRRESRADAVAALADRALKGQFGSAGAGMLYVGAASCSWTAAVSSLREVVQAADTRRPDTRRGWYDATEPDLDRLLREMRDVPQLRAFVERRLGPVIKHDSERSSKLLPTLELYLEHGGRKTDTARALHLERQSLYNRIRRIESLLGGSLDDADVRLGTHLALRVRRLLGPDAGA
jgi:purine catabolism regulator